MLLHYPDVYIANVFNEDTFVCVCGMVCVRMVCGVWCVYAVCVCMVCVWCVCVSTRRCVQVIHKLICYQKKCRIRLHYTWRELWSALINLLKFLLSNETVLLAKHNIFHLALLVVNLFNMFITYGDTFLPTSNSYDELYYEIVRMHQIFDN
uniref:Armadillo-like helical domain-containing protein n=1 Tax=Hucho hucho TaxID=62062 RepID=A0A4W5MF50_9TELE